MWFEGYHSQAIKTPYSGSTSGVPNLKSLSWNFKSPLITSVIWQGFGRSGSLQLWDLSLQGSPSFWLSLGSREASWPRYFIAIIMGWDKNCDARMELTCWLRVTYFHIEHRMKNLYPHWLDNKVTHNWPFLPI